MDSRGFVDNISNITPKTPFVTCSGHLDVDSFGDEGAFLYTSRRFIVQICAIHISTAPTSISMILYINLLYY